MYYLLVLSREGSVLLITARSDTRISADWTLTFFLSGRGESRAALHCTLFIRGREVQVWLQLRLYAEAITLLLTATVGLVPFHALAIAFLWVVFALLSDQSRSAAFLFRWPRFDVDAQLGVDKQPGVYAQLGRC